MRDSCSLEAQLTPAALCLTDVLIALETVRPAVSQSDVELGREWAEKYATAYEPTTDRVDMQNHAMSTKQKIIFTAIVGTTFCLAVYLMYIIVVGMFNV